MNGTVARVGSSSGGARSGLQSLTSIGKLLP